MKRKDFIKFGVLGSSSLLFPGKMKATRTTKKLIRLTSNGITKYKDTLPKPSVVQPVGKMKGSDYYEITVDQISQKLHSELGNTTLWGYNGLFPGPTIEARTNQSIWVKWINNLPNTHLLPVDKSIHGAAGNPEVRIITHLHGGLVPPESDGNPDHWYTPGNERTHFYPNRKQATTLWYHDHALGITRLNVYAGLAGFYIIRDVIEDHLNLPSGDYECPIVLQDRSFNGSDLYYPGDMQNGVSPSIVPEFFGDIAVVNGKIWPYLEVEPRKYRFRLLNGSNARFYRLKLVDYNDFNQNGPGFMQIGSDGGLLSEPVEIAGRLLMAPAERMDVIIDFSDFAGAELILHNNAKTPFKDEDQDSDDVPLSEIMKFKVKNSVSPNFTSAVVIPEKLTTIPYPDEKSAKQTRDLTLEESEDDFGRLLLLLNGVHYDEPVNETPQSGSKEIWRLINLTEDAHPIHLHLVQFRILDRQLFDSVNYLADKESNNLKPLSDYLYGSVILPELNERGEKDTVIARPGQVTRILAKFGDYSGRYVWHCHILEHEDHDMMRPLQVINGKSAESNGQNFITLGQNSPNPFNPTTTIQYNLPEQAHVKLAVYNVAGREVARLVDQVKAAGNHQAVFNASHLATGYYVYRIQVGAYAETKKMILIK